MRSFVVLFDSSKPALSENFKYAGKKMINTALVEVQPDFWDTLQVALCFANVGRVATTTRELQVKESILLSLRPIGKRFMDHGYDFWFPYEQQAPGILLPTKNR